MAVAPLIGVAVGVASTAASISSQNRQVAARNAAISSQISANKQSEQIRRMSAGVQRDLIKQTSQAQKIARQTAFVEEKNQLRQASVQSRLQQQQAVNDLRNQQTEAELQGNAAISQIAAEQQAVEQGLDENYINTLNSIAQTLSQIEDPTDQLENLGSQIDNVTANAIASSGSSGRTSGNLKKPNKQFVAETLNAIANGQQVSAAAMQELVTTEEFNSLVSDIVNIQSGLQQADVNNQVLTARENTNQSINSARTQGRAFRQQVRQARRGSKLNKRIGDTQARLNEQIALGQLESGIALDAAQAAQQRVALAGNASQGSSGFVNAISLASQFTPLLQFAGQGSTRPQQPTINTPGVGSTSSAGTQGVLNLLQRR